MGYILPVSQYQYEHYQVRDIKRHDRTFQIERPYKTMFKTPYTHTTNINQTYDIQIDNADKAKHYHLLYNPLSNHTVTPSMENGNEQVYADITGKGLTFNTQI